jgi:hypothetical protein
MCRRTIICGNLSPQSYPEPPLGLVFSSGSVCTKINFLSTVGSPKNKNSSWNYKSTLTHNFRKYTNAKNKWKLISEELYLENQDKDKIFRHPKQCREHYASFLDSNIVKGPWSKNEDNILLIYIALNIGEKKWCKLTRVLEGRT